MALDGKQIERALRRIQQMLRNTPRKFGQESVRFFARNFDRGGFVDNGLQKWEPRKNNKDSGRAVMVKRGELRDDIHVKSTSSRRVIVGTGADVPYARVHNEGGLIGVRSHTRTSSKGNTYRVKAYSYTMPQRRFIGESRALNRHLTQMIVRDLVKAFRR